MADSYDRYEHEGSGAGFMLGLLTGTVLGAGLGMLLAPKAGSEMRGTIGEQARQFGNRASEQYRRASSSATHWKEKGREYAERGRGFAEKGREIVDRARETVSRGTDEMRRSAGTGADATAGVHTFGSSSGPTDTDFRRP